MNAGQAAVQAFKVEFLKGINKEDFGNILVLLAGLDAIQEQPQILDESIQTLIDPIVDKIIQKLHPAPLSKFVADLYIALYYFTKIRGAKVIVKLLPNDVHLLQPVIRCLEAQTDENSQWQTRYILILWSSLICMAPFDMSVFNFEQKVEDGVPERLEIVDSILELGESFMGASSREREAAGLLIARLLTRQDINAVYIPSFLTRSARCWELGTTNYRTGLLTCLCEIYRIGNRDVLFFHTDVALETLRLIQSTTELSSNTLLRKLGIKFAQRIALAMLPPNPASWRYRNSPASLDVILKKTIESDPEDPSDQVEEILALLLETLRDQDTIVRYSAAKGIGRLTSRLPEDYALEVVDAVIHSLESSTVTDQDGLRLVESISEATWHGACLAFAELCRSGGLMPACLPRVFPLVYLALQFDIKKGSHSIGTSVRDAACYVMWSFLRCYKTEILTETGSAIATSLIVVAMFDREISVRRAASAAFQEGVGRHPDDIFPDGIAVLLLADFVAVGQRKCSFLEVAPAVFQFQNYSTSILSYLSRISSTHWDRDIRELAGGTLQLLVTSQLNQRDSFANELIHSMERLKGHVTSADISARHGGLYILGNICAGITQSITAAPHIYRSHYSSCLVALELPSEDVLSHNFKGPNAGLMYCAACHYISRLVKLRDTIYNDFQEYIKDTDLGYDRDTELTLTISKDQAQDRSWYLHRAIEALEFSDTQVVSEATDAVCNLYQSKPLREHIDKQIHANLQNPTTNPAIKGWLRLYGKLNYDQSAEVLMSAFQQTVQCAKVLNNSARDDPERRTVATTTLGQLIAQIAGLNTKADQFHEIVASLMSSLRECLSDYSIDARGDVGSWVREAAVKSTCQLLHHIEIVQDMPTPSQRLIDLLVPAVAQCCGKIDNLRQFSTQTILTALERLLARNQCAPEFEEMLALCKCIEPSLRSAVQHLTAGAPSLTTFSDLAPLLNNHILHRPLLKEYLISASSGSQSTMTSATLALSNHLEGQEPSFLTRLLEDVVDIIVSSKDDDRVLVPVLNSTANIFETQLLIDVDFEMDALFDAIQSATRNTRSIPKISAALKCYAALASTSHSVRYRAWKKLSLTLSHKFPRVRVSAAEFLYTVLSNADLEALEESLDAIHALTEVDWSLDVDNAMAQVVKSYQLP